MNKRFIRRTWCTGFGRPSLAVVHPDFHSFDSKLSTDHKETVNEWRGMDRRGNPLTVEWFNPVRGTANLISYEIEEVEQ